jgi:16S rRNA (guanine(966)-N(2))-methyltransferase RsmD
MPKSRTDPTPLRIIGGSFRGRKLLYDGRRGTRPMKDRVREAVFNLLGPGVRGQHAIDLFAGTGALGLEAISRGAAGATFVEQHYPTAELIQRNISLLGVEHVCQVISANTFAWTRTSPEMPIAQWLVLCSPPYDYYVERTEEMLALVGYWIDKAPVGSQIAVEADRRFDFGCLPDPERWQVRAYSPAVVGIYRVAVASSGPVPDAG